MRASTATAPAIYTLFPGTRAALLANAEHILGPDSTPAARARFARGVLASFARFLAELTSRPDPARLDEVLRDAAGREHFEAAAAAGKGIIAATLHMGNYEVAGLAIASLLPDVTIIYNRERVRFLERLRSRRRRDGRIAEIAIDDSPFFAIEVLARLRRRGMVLIAGEQVESRDGDPFPFLGGEASFSLWPARLALASGAPILPAFFVRGPDGKDRLHLESPLFPDAGRGARGLMEDLVQVFARYVSRHGDQWLMVRRFWR
jgi:KDO2-lipid IV(A) lauroyltransferase